MAGYAALRQSQVPARGAVPSKTRFGGVELIETGKRVRDLEAVRLVTLRDFQPITIRG